MSRHTAISALLMAFALSASGAGPERGHGAVAEAKAMLQRAATHYKEVESAQALTSLSASKAPFRDRRHIPADGAFPAYVGVSADVLKDAGGKALGDAILASVNSKAEGSVSYRIINPTTEKVETKTLFTMKIGEDVCSVGTYGAT